MTLKFSCNYRAFAGYLYVSECECGFTSSRFRMNIGWENVRSIQVDTKNIKEVPTSVLLIKLRRNHTVSFLGEDSDVVMRDNSRKLCFYAFQDLLGAKEHLISLWKTYNVERKAHSSSSQKTYGYADNTYQNSNNTYNDTRTPTNNAPTSYATLGGNVAYTTTTTNTNTACTDAIAALAPTTSYNVTEENANNNYNYNGNNRNTTENNGCYVNSSLRDKYIAPAMNIATAQTNAVSNERNYKNDTTEISNVPRNNMISTNTLTSSTGVATTINGNCNNISNNNLDDCGRPNVSSNSTQVFSPTRSQQIRERASLPKFNATRQTKLMTTPRQKEWSKMTIREVIWRILTLISSGPAIGIVMLLLLFVMLVSSLSHIFSTAHSNDLVNEDTTTLVDNILHKGGNKRHPLEHTTELLTQLQIAKTGCNHLHNTNKNNKNNNNYYHFDYLPDAIKTHDTVDMFQWIKPDFVYSSGRHQQQTFGHSCKILYNSNDEWLDALQESTLELVRNYVALQVELDSLRGRRSKRLGNYHAHDNAQHNWRLQRIQPEENVKANTVHVEESAKLSSLLQSQQQQQQQEQQNREHPQSSPLWKPKKSLTGAKDNIQSTTRERESEIPHTVVSLSTKDNSQPPALRIHTPTTTTTNKTSFVQSLLQRYSRRQRQRRRGETIYERTTHELGNFVNFFVHAFLPFLKRDRQPVLPFVDVAKSDETNNTNSFSDIQDGDNHNINTVKTESSAHYYEEPLRLDKSNNAETHHVDNICDIDSDSDCGKIYRREREEKYGKEKESEKPQPKCKIVKNDANEEYYSYTNRINNEKSKGKERCVVAEGSDDNIHNEMRNEKSRDVELEEKFSFLHIPFVDNEWHSLSDTGSKLRNTEMVQYTEVISPHFRVVQDVAPDEALEREQCVRLSWRLVHVAELLDNIFNEFSNLFMRDVYSKLANGVERPSFWSHGPRSVTSMATEALTNSEHIPYPEERILHVLLLRRYANVLLYLNPLERREHTRRADALQFIRSLTEFAKLENVYEENNKRNTIDSKKLQSEFNKLIAHRLHSVSKLTNQNERDILRNALPELSFWGRHGDLWVSQIFKLVRLILSQSTPQEHYERELHEKEPLYPTKCKKEHSVESNQECADSEEELKNNHKYTRRSNVPDELFYWKDLPVFRGLLCFTPQPTLIDSDDNEDEALEELNVKKTNRNVRLGNVNNSSSKSSSSVILQSAYELINKTKSHNHKNYDTLINLTTTTTTTTQNRSNLTTKQRTKNATLQKTMVKRHHHHNNNNNNITHGRTSTKHVVQQRDSLETAKQSKAHGVSSARVDYVPNHVVFQNDVKEIQSLWVTEHKLFSLAITELTFTANKTRHTAFKFNKEELHAHDELKIIHIRRRLVNILQQVNRDYVNPLCTSRLKKIIQLIKYCLWPPSWIRSKTHGRVQPIERIAYNEMGMRDSASQIVAAEMMEIPWGGYNDAPLKILNNLLLQPPRLLTLYFKTKTLVYTALVFILATVVIIYFVLEFA